jgi:uncharacterized protein (DUF697 family)
MRAPFANPFRRSAPNNDPPLPYPAWAGTAISRGMHTTIHASAAAAAGVAAGLSFLPGSDAPMLVGIQTTMILAIADELNVSMTRTAAAELALTLGATMAGRVVTRFTRLRIPRWSAPINAITAALLTEAVGWAAVRWFVDHKVPVEQSPPAADEPPPFADELPPWMRGAEP